jgi:hypothetical protein
MSYRGFLLENFRILRIFRADLSRRGHSYGRDPRPLTSPHKGEGSGTECAKLNCFEHKRTRASRIIPPRGTFSVDTRNENLPEKCIHQSCAKQPGARRAPGLFYCPDAITMHAGRTQPLSAGADHGAGFIVFGLLFTMSFATQTCWWAPRPYAGTRGLFSARAKR